MSGSKALPTAQQVLRWKYYISWDNPDPANSRTMLKSLKRIGTMGTLVTKTSVALAPKKGKDWKDLRSAIARNLHSRKGNAFYVNLRSGRAWQISNRAKGLWISAP